MFDLILPMLRESATCISHSALPDAPIIADPTPGPVRRHTARLLRDAAARLDHTPAAHFGLGCESST
ncbi:hypothetical protein [Actinoplanes derwentensis]|uniref:Uncharacterized protein n=1 Tax=Actinoplanes derwentensis TaxID=113562 RepID=A0A1H1YEV7_9ACTN|nr:hypothetical protein [Actinoplanes derwentensis]GID81117.1 hypothetical protein Ade03nite_00410 [Actinoplanes derwentensis]SDT19973.1 hypothetical protein SAMN04489716_2826 [Actinoplanes derwentensis]